MGRRPMGDSIALQTWQTGFGVRWSRTGTAVSLCRSGNALGCVWTSTVSSFLLLRESGAFALAGLRRARAPSPLSSTSCRAPCTPCLEDAPLNCGHWENRLVYSAVCLANLRTRTPCTQLDCRLFLLYSGRPATGFVQSELRTTGS